MSIFAKSTTNKYLVSILLIAVVVFLRFAFGGFNWSYFTVIGNEYASPSLNSDAILIQEGPGYDGQFYYGLAKEPFSFEKEKGGVIIDHPPYRHQRILYPLLTYLSSFGIDSLIPFMLVLINVISLFLSCRVIASFKFTSSTKWSFFLPFLVSGLWLSLSRDLTECLEVVLLLCALRYFLKPHLPFFILFSSLALLTRETSVIYIGTMSAMLLLKVIKTDSPKRSLIKGFVLSIPFLVLVTWKTILLNSYPNSDLISAGSNITFPFYGIYHSFVVNINGVNSLRSLIEFSVWITFLLWQFTLFFLGVRSMQFQFNDNFTGSALSLLSLVGICFALLFSISIYIDDWAFLRVLASLNIFIFLLILHNKRKLNRWFLIATIALALITIARIILRV